MWRGGSASGGDAKLHDSSAIATGYSGNSATDSGTGEVMGDSGGNGQRWVSQRETATAAADCIGQQWWQLNWWRDGNTIAMAIIMNAGGSDGRKRWRWCNLDRLQSLQRNGWRDGGAIVMLMGDGREKATQ
jgi:hypothetical protein